MSENIFEDLILQDAKELLIKSELLRGIQNIMICNKINYIEFGHLLAVHPNGLEDLYKGRLYKFTIKRLSEYLSDLMELYPSIDDGLSY